jgi:fatty acid desaturase
MESKLPATDSAKILTYKGRKYDLSRWIEHHPGGAPVIEHFLGTDATCAMHMLHDMRGKRLRTMLPKFDLGPDLERPLSDFDRDYLALEEQFVERGWFKPSLPWYIYKSCVVFAFLVGALLVPWVWLKGVLLGLFVHQCAFLAHDICHDAAVPRRFREWLGWFFGSVGFGMNHEKWTREHNLHHLIPNRPLRDPQLNSMPDLLYSYREVESFERERRPLTRGNKRMMGYAYLWLLPVLMVYGRANVIKGDVKRAFREGGPRRYLWGALLHIATFAVVIASAGRDGLLLNMLIVPGIALSLSGILHLQLILSHVYRPRLYEDEQRALGTKVQIISNQNITASWLTAWFHGGLENHIEHHLFPRMPRHNLPKLRPYVKQLCEKHGLPYNTAPFLVAVWALLGSLRRESAPLRAELAAGSRGGGLPGSAKPT